MTNKTLAFDSASARKYDRNGYLHVESSHITKEAVNPYYGREIPGWEQLGLDPEKIYKGYRAADELEKAVSTFNGLPLQLEHHVDSAANPQKEARVGSLGTSAVWSSPYIDNALAVTDKEAIDAIESGRCKELSSSYRYTPDFTAGEFNGARYDFVMRDICGNHVALVAEGRAGSDVVVADSNSIKTGADMSDPEEKKKEEAAKDSDIPAIKAAFKAFADALKGDDKAAMAAAAEELADVMTPFFNEESKEEAHKGEPVADNEPNPKEETGSDSESTEEKKEPEIPGKEGEKAAMDAALMKKAEQSIFGRVRALNEAARTVRPLIGEIVDPMAFDSAEGIYRKALELKGISTAQYSSTAYRGMVDMLLKQNTAGGASLAMDAVPQDGSPFAGVKNVRISR